MFLDLPAKSIGHIGGGKMDRTGCVDVAVIQSLYRKDEVKDFVAEYGQVIVDECHHLSAFTFEQVRRQVKAKYVVGLTATPTRKDGHHPIIYIVWSRAIQYERPDNDRSDTLRAQGDSPPHGVPDGARPHRCHDPGHLCCARE